LTSSKPFVQTARAALNLVRCWETTASAHRLVSSTPSVPELQAICRQTGCTLPELEGYALACSQTRPSFLLCGGTADLAADLSALFGFSTMPPKIPDSPTVWCLDRGNFGVRVCRGNTQRTVAPGEIPDIIAALPRTGELTTIEEQSETDTQFRFVWIPYPHHLNCADLSPLEWELLFSQRAAVALEGTPEPLVALLEELGQKLWETRSDQLTIDDERQHLRAELETLRNDRPEDLGLRAEAVWSWLVPRLLERVEQTKRAHQQMINQYEIKLSSTRHLMGQYRKNWTGGVRSLVEAYVQNRTAGPAFAPFFDAGKPGPETSSYIAALGHSALWTKLDEFVVDRMADFVAGLGGLAAKLELRQIGLGDAKARWASRTLSSKLEATLTEKRIFPSGGGKRGGLVGNLTGRTQIVIDDRKGQILKATRLTVQFIEAEFSEWAALLTAAVEVGINQQLSDSLIKKGFADPAAVRMAVTGLERLEQALQGKREASPQDDGSEAIEWLRLLTAHISLQPHSGVV